jgi:23S rRNA pseudouridine1911/1915/1917 synthase
VTRIEHRVEEAEEGLRLDSALTAAGAVGSRADAQRLIERGLVTVDGLPRQKSHRVRAGERIEVRVEQDDGEDETGPQAPFDVVLEDEHLLVVDKPAGVVVHPGAGVTSGTLAQALAGRAAGGPDPERAGIVHRLDRDTSGLLVVARSDEVHSALQDLIRRREVHREYLALVVGTPESRSGTIDAPIGRDRSNRTVMSTRTDRPRDAITHFEVLETFEATSLLRVRLETGRTHQIRAHLAAIGHPPCGDHAYGGAAAGRRLGLERQFLHSARLMFSHPITGERVDCESKPPADLHRALDAARRGTVSGGPDGD